MTDIFGIHGKALLLHQLRAEVLANNLTNASTPNFKAQDIDFVSALSDELNKQQNSGTVSISHADHISDLSSTNNDYYYQTQTRQNSMDHNTVDTDVQQTKFVENALQYQASLNFINSKIRGLLSAIKGE